MNQTRWQNGQTIADILDLLAYSPPLDNESTWLEGQNEGNHPYRDEERQVDFAVEQDGQDDKRTTMRVPRRIV